MQGGENLIAGTGKTSFLGCIGIGKGITNSAQRNVGVPIVDTEFDGDQICLGEISCLGRCQNLFDSRSAGDTVIGDIQTGSLGQRRYVFSLLLGGEGSAQSNPIFTLPGIIGGICSICYGFSAGGTAGRGDGI